jgi:hypothetical protein
MLCVPTACRIHPAIRATGTEPAADCRQAEIPVVYAPVTVLVDQQVDGVHLSYDKMESFLATYGNANATAVARNPDSKVENLLRESAA